MPYLVPLTVTYSQTLIINIYYIYDRWTTKGRIRLGESKNEGITPSFIY